jgi:tripartite-type tricarboxylate transporter receptor subunit TctC
VPFRGGGFQPEIIAGRVDFGYSPIATSLPNIKDGRLQAIAVSSPQRAAALPDVPTTLEAGYPHSDYVFWIGVFAPAGTPRDIIDRLHDEIAKALNDPAVKETIKKLGADPMSLMPTGFDAFVKAEIATNAALAKAAGITPN